MIQIFLKFFNMSISASWMILAVFLLRIILKKAPRWIHVLLWGMVALRLTCPFSIESTLSLIPSAETFNRLIMTDLTSGLQTGAPGMNQLINSTIKDTFAVTALDSGNVLKILLPSLLAVYIAVAAAMLIYAAVSYLKLRKKVSAAVRLEGNIYQSENVSSPFVIGIVSPKIYLPFKISSNNIEYIVAHERAHISRKDHWWKALGFLLIAIHWYNPLMWLAYVFFCRDIELACDEKVIRTLNSAQKADYAQTLLNYSVNNRRTAVRPIAFGEVNVKERMKSIMNYKKPSFWIMILALIACVVTAACFLTNPKNSKPEYSVPNKTNDISQYRTEYIGEATKVVSIAQLLPYPNGYSYSHIQARTVKEPYELIVYLNGNSPVQAENFKECADTAFKLIGNMGIITFKDSDSSPFSFKFSFTRPTE